MIQKQKNGVIINGHSKSTNILAKRGKPKTLNKLLFYIGSLPLYVIATLCENTSLTEQDNFLSDSYLYGKEETLREKGGVNIICFPR